MGAPFYGYCMLLGLILATLSPPAEEADATPITNIHMTRNKHRPVLGKLLADLVSLSQSQRAVLSPCTSVLVDSKHENEIITSAFARTTPFFISRVHLGQVEKDLSLNASSIFYRALRNTRACGCGLLAIFLENGRHLVRLLQRAERARNLESRAHLVLLYDARLFAPALHGIWRRLVNVIFVRKTSRHGFELSTVNFPAPVDLDHPEKLLPKPVAHWYRGLMENSKTVFADKTRNLLGNPVNIAYYDHLPSVVAAYNKSSYTRRKQIKLSGVEVEIVRLLSRALKFYPVFLHVENRTGGVIHAVANGRADLALGNLPHLPYYLRRFNLSPPYAAYCLSFLVPEALTDRSRTTLLLPLKSDLWIALGVTFVLGWITQYLIARLQKSDSGFACPVVSLLNTWSMQMLISLSDSPKGWPLRILFGCVWIHCLLLGVTYRASFSSQLAQPPLRFTTDTLAQLAAARHLTPLTWTAHTREFLLSSHDDNVASVGARLQETSATEAEIVTQVLSGSYAFMENIHLLRYMQKKWQPVDQWQETSYITELNHTNLHIMQECVATLPISLGLARNSALTDVVGETLLRAVEMGLVDKWLRDATASRGVIEAEQQALVSIRKIIGAFIALGTGYLASFLVLMAELVVDAYSRYRCRKRQRIKNGKNVREKKNEKNYLAGKYLP